MCAIGCSAVVSCSKWCSIWFKINSNVSLDILKQASNRSSWKVFQTFWNHPIFRSKRQHRLFLFLFSTLRILTNVKHKFENSFYLCLCLNIKEFIRKQRFRLLWCSWMILHCRIHQIFFLAPIIANSTTSKPTFSCLRLENIKYFMNIPEGFTHIINYSDN